MKMRILFLASILVALVGMLAVPGMEAEVKEANACPGWVCLIPPSGGGEGSQADAVARCYAGCTDCCQEVCGNLAPGADIVGSANCYCTVGGSKRRCDPPGP